MADFTALHAATFALRDVLRTAVTDSPEPSLTGVLVDLRSPREMKDANNAEGLSLWLYRVERFAELTNDMPLPVAPDLQPRRALPLELSYLLTPVFKDPEKRLLVAGRVLETFNDHATLATGGMDLRIALDPVTLDAHTGVVQSLGVPWTLAVPYVVNVVTVESALPPQRVPRVLTRDAAYAQITGSGTP